MTRRARTVDQILMKCPCGCTGYVQYAVVPPQPFDVHVVGDLVNGLPICARCGVKLPLPSWGAKTGSLLVTLGLTTHGESAACIDPCGMLSPIVPGASCRVPAGRRLLAWLRGGA